LEKDTGPLSDAVVYGTNVPTAAAPPATIKIAPAFQPQVQKATQNNAAGGNLTGQQTTSKEKVLSLKDQINATKQRLANMGKPGSISGGNSAIGSQIGSSVAEAKARLAKVMESLHDSSKQTVSA
jgi:hypothetical protein